MEAQKKKKNIYQLHRKEIWFSSQKLIQIRQKNQPVVKPATPPRTLRLPHLLKRWELRGGAHRVWMDKPTNPHSQGGRCFSEGVTRFWLHGGDSSGRLQAATAPSQVTAQAGGSSCVFFLRPAFSCHLRRDRTRPHR